MKFGICILLVISGCNSLERQNWNDEELNINILGLKENDREIIYRPCSFRNLRCIRQFFADNSKCTISKGPAPDPLIFKTDTVYLPYANVTVVLENVQTSGLNSAEIKEFYINKATGNVVLAVDFKGLSERSTVTKLRYKRTAQEPIILSDYTTVTYGLITMTAVIPKAPNLQLDKADIHADVADSNPPYVVGPKAYNSTDPNVQMSFRVMTSALPQSLRESFLLKSTALMTVFIQNNICNFGLKFYSY